VTPISFDVWDQSSGNSLVSVPVGAGGLVVYTVPSDKELSIGSITLWVADQVGQQTPSIAVQDADDNDPPEPTNLLLWRASPGDRRFSWQSTSWLTVPAGHSVVLRTAGAASPAADPSIGYSFQGILVDA